MPSTKKRKPRIVDIGAPTTVREEDTQQAIKTLIAEERELELQLKQLEASQGITNLKSIAPINVAIEGKLKNLNEEQKRSHQLRERHLNTNSLSMVQYEIASHVKKLKQTIASLTTFSELSSAGVVLDSQIKELQQMNSFALKNNKGIPLSVCTEVDNELSRLSSELVLSDKRLSACRSDDELTTELEVRNALKSSVLKELIPHQAILQESDLTLEVKYQTLMRELASKLKKKEEHQKIGLNAFTTDIWKRIEDYYSELQSQIKLIDKKLAEKVVPNRKALLAARINLLETALFEINREQLYLEDIYPSKLSEQQHLDNIEMVLKLYDQLKEKVRQTNNDLGSNSIAEAEDTVEEHRKFLQEALTKVENVIERVTKSLHNKQSFLIKEHTQAKEDKAAVEQQASLQSTIAEMEKFLRKTANSLRQKETTNLLTAKDYANIATAIAEIMEQKNRIITRCDYVTDKIELIKKDTQIAQEVAELEQMTLELLNVHGLVINASGYGSGSLLFENLRPLFRDAKLGFTAEAFQVKTPTASVQVDFGADERKEFKDERDRLLASLQERREEYNQLYQQLRSFLREQQTILAPLKNDLKTYLEEAETCAAIQGLDNRRFIFYQRIYEALTTDYDNTSANPRLIAQVQSLLNCRLYSHDVNDSQLAVNLRDEIAGFAKIRETFQKNFPEITLDINNHFVIDNNCYPMDAEPLPKNIQEAIASYAAARENILSNHAEDPRGEMESLRQTKRLINTYVIKQRFPEISLKDKNTLIYESTSFPLASQAVIDAVHHYNVARETLIAGSIDPTVEIQLKSAKQIIDTFVFKRHFPEVSLNGNMVSYQGGSYALPENYTQKRVKEALTTYNQVREEILRKSDTSDPIQLEKLKQAKKQIDTFVFEQKFPDITLVQQGQKLLLGTQLFPTSSSPLPENITKAATDYIAARSKLLSGNAQDATDERRKLEKAQTTIDRFVVQERQEDERKLAEAERKAAELKKQEEELKQLEELTKKYMEFKQKFETHLNVVNKKISLLNTIIESINDEADKIKEAERVGDDDSRVILLTGLMTPFINHRSNLEELKESIEDSKIIINQPVPQGIEALKERVQQSQTSLTTIHRENSKTADLQKDVEEQLTPGNLARLSVATSAFEQVLQFIDKVIIPKLYKLIHTEEKPYKPGFFSASTTEKNLFAFRESIMEKVRLNDVEAKAAPSA
ncbi:hypothetical protein [Legionella cardiaca]|uniref:Coiled-coil protein n=1 Tax=Legionella cardiaca TaxID=1071983 RepID=A0ABY8AR28_9GAMM|nr:hypothetical protein [Legionella cardiaca]WED42973.1 hypothetical protein PXX05_13895 [Legionella cardiaca]